MDELRNIKRMPTADIVLALGKRFKEYRIATRMTQQEVSEKSGVSLPTIRRFELGLTYNITMGNFIALLKAIGYEDGLAEILPEMPASPYLMAKAEKSKKKRVRHGE
jgi:transcriptional regulator with XRE-family HTH domain